MMSTRGQAGGVTVRERIRRPTENRLRSGGGQVSEVSLEAGVVPVAALLVGLLALTLLAVPGSQVVPGWWSRRVPAAVAVGVGLAVVVGVVSAGAWQPFSTEPWVASVGTAVVLTGVALAVLRRGPAGVTALSIGLVAALTVSAAVGVNAVVGTYPTLGAALGTDSTVGASPAPALRADPGDVVPTAPDPAAGAAVVAAGGPLAATWTPPPGLPADGEVTTEAIPAPVSGFQAGDAWVYLPPAYHASPRPALPVLLLLSGQPGAPEDWFNGGDLAATMDTYAAEHGGLAPIVVVPDWLGTSGDNPLCVDSAAGGQDATYLGVDVHDWIVGTLGADPDPAHWAVGGLSAGGTCALQMATRDPGDYPTVLAFSTQDHPQLENGDDTVDTLFDGDLAAYDANDPMALLAAGGDFSRSAGFFAAGADDDVYGPQTEAVYDAARDAGMDVRYATLPGGHDFDFWAAALQLATPWLGTRLGITS